MASKARIAAYKICWIEECSEADILAGIDEAVADGVDVISISVGIASNHENYLYYNDPFAVGTFGAIQQGVLVSCAAGNSGPEKSSLENFALWILTVGASTIDRDFPADVTLVDGSVHRGISVYPGEPHGPSYLPIVYAGDHRHRRCVPGTLKPGGNVKGKIVVCEGGLNNNMQKGRTVKLGGEASMIIMGLEVQLRLMSFLLLHHELRHCQVAGQMMHLRR